MRESNPYAAPAVIDQNQIVLPEDPVRLLGIAKAQRGLMLCNVLLECLAGVICFTHWILWSKSGAGHSFLARQPKPYGTAVKIN